MQLTTFLLSALPALTLAAPSAPVLSERQCNPIFPLGTTRISLSKAAGAPSTSQYLTWNLPSPASGPCTMIATFPANYPITSSGNAQVNIIDVNGPAPGAIVGTVAFSSETWGPKKTYINSFACRANMKYRLELATEGQGSVSFNEGNGAGVAFTVGC